MGGVGRVSGVGVGSVPIDLDIDSDDGVILLGNEANPTEKQFSIVRLSADGSADQSFGTNGRTLVNLSNSSQTSFEEEPTAVTLMPNGRIVAAGRVTFSDLSNNDFALVRLIGSTVDDPPTADAGPDQAVLCNQTVFLNGTGSFDDNTPPEDLQYSWQLTQRPPGSIAILFDADTPHPFFVVDLSGTYVAELIVTDSLGQSSPPPGPEAVPGIDDDARVFISSENLPPTADAGEDAVTFVGNPTMLDGTGSSDPNGDALTYSWAILTAPSGSMATIVPLNDPTPVFTPDLVGAYEIVLGVSDGCEPIPSIETVILCVLSPGDYSQGQVLEALDGVSSLEPGQVTTTGNQTAMEQLLMVALAMLEMGQTANAQQKLEQALERTDGCAERGVPDPSGPGMDWITDCASQLVVYDFLQEALAALN